MMRWHMIDLSPAQRGPCTVKNFDASHCGFGGGGCKLLVDNRRSSVTGRPEVEWSRKQDARGREGGKGGREGGREGGRARERESEPESERVYLERYFITGPGFGLPTRRVYGSGDASAGCRFLPGCR